MIVLFPSFGQRYGTVRSLLGSADEEQIVKPRQREW
jgi:hypothetical protein